MGLLSLFCGSTKKTEQQSQSAKAPPKPHQPPKPESNWEAATVKKWIPHRRIAFLTRGDKTPDIFVHNSEGARGCGAAPFHVNNHCLVPARGASSRPLFLLCTQRFLDSIGCDDDTKRMSSPERRKRAERPRPQKNTELADILQKIREESGTPAFSRANDIPPPLSQKKEKKLLRQVPPEIGRAKPRRVTLENGKTRVEVFDDEIGAYVQDPTTMPPESVSPPPVPLLNVDAETVGGLKKETWQRQAQLERLRGQGILDAKYSPPPIPPERHKPPPPEGLEEQLEKERARFEDESADLKWTFKKTFIPTKEEKAVNMTARRLARKFVAQKLEPAAPPRSDMIRWLDAWTHGDKTQTGREQLDARLAEHFPARKFEIGGHAHAVALTMDELPEEAARDAHRHRLEPQRRFVSAWIRERYDAFNRARITKVMIPMMFGINALTGSRKLRSALGLTVFAAAMTGAGRELQDLEPMNLGTGLSIPDASADTIPIASPSPADATPLQGVAASPPVTLLNPQPNELPDFIPQDRFSASEGDMHQVAYDHADTGHVAEPIEVQGNVSVWSSLLDGLGEKGVDLSKSGEQAFAQAVQRAVEDTGTQSVFLEYKGKGISGVAWDKVPDGATIHLDLLFGDLEFLDRLKELLGSSEYRSLGKEVQAMGGVDAFISDVQDAFGVRYL